MKDLLKEAIADAKAVRETALANAKLALEEAFTPRLQSMLSAKLAEELSDDEEEMTEIESDEYANNNEKFDEGEEHEEASEETEMSDSEAPEETEDDDLDLEEIIRELEMEEADGEEDMESMEEGDEDMESMEEGDYADDMSDEMDEDIDINEIIRSLREEDDEEGSDDHGLESEPAEEELEEAYNVIRFLKGKINEVNLLNAKLLYSNKLFRNFSLNEGQKMKVIENFDRAHNLREVKLVYSTLAEGFKMPSSKKVVKESFASKPVASTKPAKQVISEGAELANRFKKLAGLK